MEKISFLTLRKQMPRVRERLKAGESFILTDRGKVIAVLQPVFIGVDRADGVDTTVAVAKESSGAFTVVDVDRRPSKSPQELRDEILRGVRTGKR